MFDVGDFAVLTFDNCVLKTGVVSETVRTFLTFFPKSKKHDFLRVFELLHTFSRTLSGVWRSG